VETIGKVESYDTVYPDWATVQNTPLKYWKNYSHEGGICSPLIVFWPGRITKPGSISHQPTHFVDIMATLVDITGKRFPETHNGQETIPLQGASLRPAFNGQSLKREKPMFWHWKDGGAVREGRWKAVFWKEQWELFDLRKDRNEMVDLAAQHPERLERMKAVWREWRASMPEFEAVPSDRYEGP